MRAAPGGRWRTAGEHAPAPRPGPARPAVRIFIAGGAHRAGRPGPGPVCPQPQRRPRHRRQPASRGGVAGQPGRGKRAGGNPAWPGLPAHGEREDSSARVDASSTGAPTFPIPAWRASAALTSALPWMRAGTISGEPDRLLRSFVMAVPAVSIMPVAGTTAVPSMAAGGSCRPGSRRPQLFAAGTRPLATRGHRAGGFTLIELLVALVIFATMAGIAYTGLDAVSRSHAVLSAHEDELAALGRGLAVLERDLRSLAPRPIRDSQGQPLPALLAQARYLELSSWPRPRRRGRPGPDRAPCLCPRQLGAVAVALAGA